MAEWSKALESGSYGNLSSPKGRGFEPHFCHSSFFASVDLLTLRAVSQFFATANNEQHLTMRFADLSLMHRNGRSRSKE